MLPQGMEINKATAQTQSPPVMYRGTWGGGGGRQACRKEVTLYAHLQVLLAPPTVRAGYPASHIMVTPCHVLGKKKSSPRDIMLLSSHSATHCDKI